MIWERHAGYKWVSTEYRYLGVTHCNRISFIKPMWICLSMYDIGKACIWNNRKTHCNPCKKHYRTFKHITFLKKQWCCCLPCNHYSNSTWLVEKMLADGNRLRYTHCREYPYMKLCRPAYFIRTTQLLPHPGSSLPKLMAGTTFPSARQISISSSTAFPILPNRYLHEKDWLLCDVADSCWNKDCSR